MFRNIIFFILSLVLFSLPAQAIETSAKQAYLIDSSTSTVLYEKSSTERMPPSSMSKLMTSYAIFLRLKEGRLKLSNKFLVSEKAWRTQGSKTFVALNSEISVEDLIHGIVVQSGNDACVVAAEGLSGSEEDFAKHLNEIAAKIGMKNSHFMNASGLPDDEHYVTAHDLAILSQRLIEDFPEYYHYFAIPEFTYHKIRQFNRNRLLKKNFGVDGLKTGHTEAAGYGIALSAKQKGRRLILVINGTESEKEREEEGEKLLRWGFREFENVSLAPEGKIIAEADVWFGESKTVSLVSNQDILLTIPAGSKDSIKHILHYTGPVPAPISKGSHIADLIISVNDKELKAIPLMAANDVAKLSGFSYMIAKLKHHIWGN